MTNIVLTGMRGSGKSNLARKIATTLKRKHIDIDQEICRQERSSIPSIVNRKGWNYFRKMEKYVTRRVSKHTDIVISTGGGTIIDPENYRKLKKHGVIVYLKAPPEVLIERIESKEAERENRPPLTNKNNLKEELETVLAKRSETYEKTADFVIDASTNTEDYKKDVRERGQELLETIAKVYPEFEKPTD